MGGSLGSIDNSQDGIIIRSLVPLLHCLGLFHPNFVHDEDLVVFLDLLSKETGNSLVFRFRKEADRNCTTNLFTLNRTEFK